MGTLLRLSVVLLLALAAAGFSATQAEARELWIEDFASDMTVGADGSVAVTERIRVRFEGSWNGIFRFIPYRYQFRTGIRGSIRLRVESVEDEQGVELEHWISKRQGNLEVKIRVPGAANATRTVMIRYVALNAIRLYEEEDADFGAHDELYWNVTGTGWQVPIAHASAKVTLPEGVPVDKIRSRMYVGAYGSSAWSDRGDDDDDNALLFETSRPLAPHEGLTIVVGFPPGHVEHPSTAKRIGWFVADNYFLILPLLALLAWWLLWRKFGRDDLSRHTIIPEFEAPSGLRPAEVGVLADDRFDQRDMSATIVDLAVRGVLKLEHRGKNVSTRVHLDRDQLANADLSEYERELITALFGDHKTERRMSELKYKFYKQIDDIKRTAVQGLVRKQLFHKDPKDVSTMWSVLTVVAILSMGGLGLVFKWPPPYWMALVVCAVPMIIIARHMPQRTHKGLDALARVRGLEDYLTTAEQDRMRALPMSQLEALIPYAIALGVADKWLDAFAEIYEQQPEWIDTAGQGYSAHTLGRVMNTMQSDVGKSLYSGPRASTSTSSSGFGGSFSGSSGFGGGGFSGGGMGGGGGGGW